MKPDPLGLDDMELLKQDLDPSVPGIVCLMDKLGRVEFTTDAHRALQREGLNWNR
jgi:hypothetical protein